MVAEHGFGQEDAKCVLLLARTLQRKWLIHTVIDPYGSTESTRVDGELVSALVTWDSKVLTVVSILGGVADVVREKMQADGIYEEFISVVEVS